METKDNIKELFQDRLSGFNSDIVNDSEKTDKLWAGVKNNLPIGEMSAASQAGNSSAQLANKITKGNSSWASKGITQLQTLVSTPFKIVALSLYTAGIVGATAYTVESINEKEHISGTSQENKELFTADDNFIVPAIEKEEVVEKNSASTVLPSEVDAQVKSEDNSNYHNKANNEKDIENSENFRNGIEENKNEVVENHTSSNSNEVEELGFTVKEQIVDFKRLRKYIKQDKNLVTKAIPTTWQQWVYGGYKKP